MKANAHGVRNSVMTRAGLSLSFRAPSVRRSDLIRFLGATVMLGALLGCTDVSEPGPAGMLPAAEGSLTAQVGTWQLQAPLATGEDVHGVDRISLADAWAVGDGGLILHSADGGVTWTRQTSGTTEQLDAVRFLDASRGWAVGNAVLYTVNGGQTWQTGSYPGGTLSSVDFSDPLHGVAVGISGYIVKTVNGGRTWTVVPSPTGSSLSAVAFGNVSNAWAVGANGTIIRTTNGGTSWSNQSSGSTAWFGGLSFLSGSEGWAVGGKDILHTTNGGSSWQSQTVPSPTWVNSVSFTDPLNGWAGGSQQNIIHTTNGGQTWVTQLGGIGSPPYNRNGFAGVSFADAQNGVAVGGGGIVFTTTNGGANWVPRQSGSSSHTYRLSRTDASHLWAANSDAEILYTTDGGGFWNRVNVFAFGGSNMGDIDFAADNLNGWVVVNGTVPGTSFVFHSNDGGATWQQQNNTPATGGLSGVAALSAQTAVAVSSVFNIVIRTTDGGATWVSIPHPSVPWFSAVRFLDAQTGWAVGSGGSILKSTDGGATWVSQISGTTNPLFDINFADANNGWAVGAVGTLLHTTNGGATWLLQNSGTTTGVFGVSAISSTTAWISGFNGFVASTSTSGSSWTPENLGTATSFYTTIFLDASNGWVAGEVGGSEVGGPVTQGRIYRRTGTVGTPPSAPSNLTATPQSRTVGGQLQVAVRLNWLDQSSNETSFVVERCTGSTCTSFVSVANLGANTIKYFDQAVARGTTYRYRVRASNAAGSSGPSNIAQATTP